MSSFRNLADLSLLEIWGGEVRARRVQGETRDLGPGGTWRILGGRPHDVVAGPEGAVVIDVFTPVRSDWDEKVQVEPAPAPRWPEA